MLGRRNYALCLGDKILDNHSNQNMRGMFAYMSACTFAEIVDGTSNTIMLGEKANAIDASDVRGLGANNVTGLNTNPSICLTKAAGKVYLSTTAVQSSRPLGALWHSGLAPFVGLNTVLPPNAPTCLNDNWGDNWGVYAASSYHPGGVNVTMGDGRCSSSARRSTPGTSRGRKSQTAQVLTASGALWARSAETSRCRRLSKRSRGEMPRNRARNAPPASRFVYGETGMSAPR